MQKSLLLTPPPSETYQCTSFFIAILIAHPSIQNYYYNNFINLKCRNSSESRSTELTYITNHWEYIRPYNFAQIDEYNLKNIPRNQLVPLLKKCIDDNKYLLLYMVDDYYLSYSASYKSIHYIHDTYIYGYDNDSFLVQAYSNANLHLLKVPAEEIEESLYNINTDLDVTFKTLYIDDSKNVELDLHTIYTEFNNYLNGVAPNDLESFGIYGMNTYKALFEFLEMIPIQMENSENLLDYRILRFFWEHKESRTILLQYIKGSIHIDDEILLLCNKISKLSCNLFNQFLKYTIQKNPNHLEKMNNYLERIEELDYTFTTSMIEILKRELEI
ncbi:hypothetical protein QA584_03620 [Anaerocolumna sp. AGMB13025]|uniref:hypothetical protein n=1 Tax=Anaerocolumna sp. AGMB13025 TaxID=3039116 RepID=UPI00241DD385|nr:hypothetical protein [Anaerocolumna sp. AGMB13025]WFR58165.1 hypothetical protein QA584_03620 [Anaerocolumna sp. AGMB13025]